MIKAKFEQIVATSKGLNIMGAHTKLARFIKISFWFFCLPLVGIEALYFLINHLNPLESNLFLFSAFLCIPMAWLKSNELQDQSYNSIVDEYRAMTTNEFLGLEQQVMNLPVMRHSGMYKEAYRQVFKERYGRQI